MKPGDMVRIIPELEDEEPFKVLWDDPPSFESIYRKCHVGKFSYNDVGIVLEQKEIPGDAKFPLHIQTFWVKVLPTFGGCGWIKRCDLELV